MESESCVEFVKGDRIYNNGTVDKTKIYKIVSVNIETCGDLKNYLVRYIAIVIPENQTSVKDFGECWVIQSIIDGKTYSYAVKV